MDGVVGKSLGAKRREGSGRKGVMGPAELILLGLFDFRSSKKSMVCRFGKIQVLKSTNNKAMLRNGINQHASNSGRNIKHTS